MKQNSNQQKMSKHYYIHMASSWIAVASRMIAYNYNRPGYEADSYHVNLEAAYNDYKKAGV